MKYAGHNIIGSINKNTMSEELDSLIFFNKKVSLNLLRLRSSTLSFIRLFVVFTIGIA